MTANGDVVDTSAQEVLDKANDPGPHPTVHPPSNPYVDLPGGGLWDPLTGRGESTAEVRELDGEDEEAIARAGGNLARMLDVVLQRGVVAVGSTPADKDVLNRLLAGDRDALLVAIRRVTFGEIMGPFSIKCPSCGDEQELTINLAEDIPSRRLDSVSDRWFEIDLPSGKHAKVELADGETQRALALSEETNDGVLNTILLHRCTKEIDRMPVVSEQQVRKLSIRDRNAIIVAIDERTPGPRLTEVSKTCEACGADIPTPLGLGDLFRL